MKTTNVILKLCFLALLFVACEQDDAPILEDELAKYEHGIIVSAEGNWGAKDGSISYVANDYSLSKNFLYQSVNGAQLGSLIQSMAFEGDYAYIILDDANQIVKVDRYTFEKKAVISTGIKSPRYMAFANGKGYVTNWGEPSDENDDYIAVIDLEANKVIESEKISLANGVERILANNGMLYVSHKGGWSVNNIISVVDATSKSVATIEVNEVPDDMAFNTAGQLVVLAEGGQVWGQDEQNNWYIVSESKAALHTIDLTNNSVVNTIEFADGVHPNLLDVSDGKIYYHIAYAGLSAIDENALDLNSAASISQDNLYGLSVKDGKVYQLKSAFETLSELQIKDATTGATVFATAVGLGASKIYFNE